MPAPACAECKQPIRLADDRVTIQQVTYHARCDGRKVRRGRAQRPGTLVGAPGVLPAGISIGAAVVTNTGAAMVDTTDRTTTAALIAQATRLHDNMGVVIQHSRE